MQAANQAFWIRLVILLACTVGLETTSAQQSDKPNILFILNDNTGYGDIGVYGGGESRGAPTPRIDRLASDEGAGRQRGRASWSSPRRNR